MFSWRNGISIGQPLPIEAKRGTALLPSLSPNPLPRNWSLGQGLVK